MEGGVDALELESSEASLGGVQEAKGVGVQQGEKGGREGASRAAQGGFDAQCAGSGSSEEGDRGQPRATEGAVGVPHAEEVEEMEEEVLSPEASLGFAALQGDGGACSDGSEAAINGDGGNGGGRGNSLRGRAVATSSG